MPRGLGRNNMSEAELKVAKRKRDAEAYERRRDELRRKTATAKIVMCDKCGTTYKDYKGGLYSHLTTGPHQLYVEETERGLVPLVCKKITTVNNKEEARQYINNHYMENNKFKPAEKELHLPRFIRALNKLEDKPQPPPPPPPVKKKLKIKRKLNIVKPDTD